jgi:hypothetical protein
MIETVLIAVLTTLLLTSIYAIARVKKQAINLALQNAQMFIDQNILEQKIMQINEDKRLVESEEFMQFMMSSRNHAFEYIETVQKAIDDFRSVMEPIVEYHESYGSVLGETPDWKTINKISLAYKSLIKVLPQEDEIKND